MTVTVTALEFTARCENGHADATWTAIPNSAVVTVDCRGCATDAPPTLLLRPELGGMWTARRQLDRFLRRAGVRP